MECHGSSVSGPPLMYLLVSGESSRRFWLLIEVAQRSLQHEEIKIFIDAAQDIWPGAARV